MSWNLLAESSPSFTYGGMSTRAHVAIVVVTLIGLAFVLRMVRRHRLKSKYTMLWLGTSAALIVLVLFPNLLTRASNAIGIYYPPATFLAVAVGVLLLIVVQFSWELSKSEEHTRTLAEEAAMLRARVERLEAAQEADESAG